MSWTARGSANTSSAILEDARASAEFTNRYQPPLVALAAYRKNGSSRHDDNGCVIAGVDNVLAAMEGRANLKDALQRLSQGMAHAEQPGHGLTWLTGIQDPTDPNQVLVAMRNPEVAKTYTAFIAVKNALPEMNGHPHVSGRGSRSIP